MPRVLADLDDDMFDDGVDESDARPLARRRREWPWLRMLLLSGAIVAGLVHLAQNEEPKRVEDIQGPREIPAANLIAPAPAWVVIDKAASLFAVEKNPSPHLFEARRHRSGGRADVIAFGAPGDPGYARLVLGATGVDGRRSLYLDLVKAAAEAGLSVVRSAQSENLQTKFGTMETASIILADRAEQTCQAFRFDDPSFGILGWRCTAGTASTDDAQLACFIERITLVDGDAALKSLFAQTERRRTGACGSPARTAAMGSAKPISRP